MQGSAAKQQFSAAKQEETTIQEKQHQRRMKKLSVSAQSAELLLF